MDKEAELRRIRLGRLKEITARIRDLQTAKVGRLNASLGIIRQQERELLDKLGRDIVADKLLLQRLQNIGRQSLALAAEIEAQGEIARDLGRRAKGVELLLEKTFRSNDVRRS
jgi:hypothetical protein